MAEQAPKRLIGHSLGNHDVALGKSLLASAAGTPILPD
jgi:hypothetical protein